MKSMKLLTFATIAVSFSIFLSSCSKPAAQQEADAAKKNDAATVVEVTTTNATAKDLPSYFEATGTLASDAQTDVAPTIGGRIIEVNFDVGRYVNRGDVLVRLDPQDAQIRLQQASRQVEQAKVQIEQVKATVKQAQAGVEQAKANVRQQQIRLGLTEGSNFDINGFSQVLALKAQLDLAEKELRRTENFSAREMYRGRNTISV